MVMRVAMMTTVRRPQYLEASLASFFERDPAAQSLSVRVVVDDSRAPQLPAHERIVLDMLAEDDAKRRATWKISRRIAATYRRCLGSVLGQGAGVLILQDDIELAHGWLRSLEDAVSFMRAKEVHALANGNPFRWALSLYSRGALGAGDCCTFTHAHMFYGSVAMYWPASEVEELCAYFDGRADSDRPDDLLIRDYLVTNVIGLYAMNPNIVQHTGRKSSHGAQFVTTSNYRSGAPPEKAARRPGPAPQPHPGTTLLRWELIDELLPYNGRYLEIGIAGGHCISRVSAFRKWGVDPNPQGPVEGKMDCLYRGTSDDFFRSETASNGKLKFDVVFIDGHHESEQVYRDVENAMRLLTRGGVILLHDCNPLTDESQRVPRPPEQGIWNGDCWRAVARLRQRADLDVFVIDSDHGLGVVLPKGTQQPLPAEDVSAISWEQFDDRREELLGLVSPTSDWRARLRCGAGRVTFVTAIFGPRGDLKEPTRRWPGHEYICFTDRERQSDAWQIRQMPTPSDPRLAARRIKLLIHEHVDAEHIVWVDASMHCVGDLRRCFAGATSDIVAFEHPVRNCVYAEAAACREQRRGNAVRLDEQITRYRHSGYPKGAGLFATGLLARRMTEEVRSLGRAWYAELERGSCRDQVSFPYVLHDGGVSCHRLRGDVYANDLVRCAGHTGMDMIASARANQARRPVLHTAIAFDPDMNLGAAYNRTMALLPEDGWACFLDHDAMFTTRYWHEQVLRAIELHPGAGAFTAVTNRIGNADQVALGIDPGNHDVAYHRTFGAQLADNHALRDVTSGPLISGVLIVLSKAAWKAIGGFQDGFLGIDNQMHLDLKRAGKRVFVIEGLYVYHWYRANSDGPLEYLTDKDRWRPR